MHRLAVAEAVARLTDDDVERMRAANRRFAAAIEAHDTDAALTADDDFHRVAVEVSGNRALATVLDQFGPVVRRLERRRFASHAGEQSVALHERLVEACAGRDVRPPPTSPSAPGRTSPTSSPTPTNRPRPTSRRSHEPRAVRAPPAHLRPLARPPPEAALRPPRGEGRRRPGVGQARGRQQRSRLRWQQGPQARVHRPRRAGQRRRHPRLHRRLPVQPHPPGRRGRRPPRPEVPAGAGEVGAVGRPDQHPGRQHPAQPDDGRRLPPRPARLRHRHPRLVEGRDPRGRGGRRHAVRHPGGRQRAPARRPRVRQLGLRGGRAGEGARHHLRHDRGLHASPARPTRG